MSTAIQRLAAQITRLERNVRALSITPQLAHSSIEDGGSVNSNNADGTTMAQYGGQFDGSYMAASLVGPTPPTPSAPIVTAAVGGLTVRWDGIFTDALFAPMDFTRVEVHVSTVAAFVPDTATTLVATIESPRGALPFIARPIGIYYVAFVARSQSGTAGPKSATTGPITTDNGVVIAGTLNVTGNTVIGGTLSLPAGIIDNAALASPVIPESVYAIATNFGLTTSYVTKTSVTIEVPAGFTKAVVAMVGRVFAYNPNTTGGGGDGADYLYGRVTIAGVAGVGLPSVVPGWTSSGLNVAPMSRVLTGLTPGSTFTILLSARTSYAAWAAHADHNAELSGNIMWFR